MEDNYSDDREDQTLEATIDDSEDQALEATIDPNLIQVSTSKLPRTHRAARISWSHNQGHLGQQDVLPAHSPEDYYDYDRQDSTQNSQHRRQSRSRSNSFASPSPDIRPPFLVSFVFPGVSRRVMQANRIQFNRVVERMGNVEPSYEDDVYQYDFSTPHPGLYFQQVFYE